MEVCGFRIKQRLGKGVEGSVYLVEGGFAIKKVPNKKINLMITELDILSRVNHMNVVSALAILKEKDHVCLKMEAGHMDLAQWINLNIKNLPFENMIMLSLLVANGLYYLHANNILHLDLHAGNIIVYLKENRVFVKIADFGFARNGDERWTRRNFNWYLSPPEVNIKSLEQEDIDIGFEFDNWYLGNVIHYINFGYYPFYDHEYYDYDNISALYQIKNLAGLTPNQVARLEKEPKPNFNTKLKEINENYKLSPFWDLFNPDPEKRGTAESVLKQVDPTVYVELNKSPAFVGDYKNLPNLAEILEPFQMMIENENVLIRSLDILDLVYQKTEILDLKLIFSICVDLAFALNGIYIGFSFFDLDINEEMFEAKKLEILDLLNYKISRPLLKNVDDYF